MQGLIALSDAREEDEAATIADAAIAAAATAAATAAAAAKAEAAKANGTPSAANADDDDEPEASDVAPKARTDQFDAVLAKLIAKTVASATSAASTATVASPVKGTLENSELLETLLRVLTYDTHYRQGKIFIVNWLKKLQQGGAAGVSRFFDIHV